MFDAAVRQVIDRPLNRAGATLAAWGATANQVTAAGLALGLAAAGAVAFERFGLALLLIAASRLCDGLDGAVARATRKTAFGGYLDITADFLFYGAVPLGFILADPASNGIAGGVLLTSFYFNGASFLGYAILAEKRAMATSHQGEKSLYFSNGLLEGTETIAFFVAICLFPGAFPVLAAIFAALCFVTATLRIHAASKIFAE
ncbi:CDP-alcohol phosphatidyltransferase family protein [Palleronia sediminis]|uniref:CDP-alcohol phosphatidyltransferase family protein n=1 Tax=Palleronia sediminis TaxID=2547833 RepID=A0A4V3BA29_9RHOB|nr:CDP-alcohol phosphatidyltransferase family protein [Palleronia sediminis]TDL81529.1 CDP-alcohol phosphatidyltransferase family protein [Palleronia sediminis]